MNSKILQLALISLFMISCGKQKPPQKLNRTPKAEVTNSLNPLDWPGTYKGVIPCADCEGIEQELTLNDNNTFTLKSNYLGKLKNNKSEETGILIWDKAGNIITAETKDQSTKVSYIIDENTLIQLDNEKREITGPLAENYKLKK